jgi:predicted Fe-Mo cluster-binding NifX family protein
MKIAVPVDNGLVNDHFGHSENFVVYTISPENKVVSVNPVAQLDGCGCKSGIAQTLAEQGVSVMLAGNIGAGAINHLHAFGIDVVRGCFGEADKAVKDFLAGSIRDNNQTCTNHEGCHDHTAN